MISSHMLKDFFLVLISQIKNFQKICESYVKGEFDYKLKLTENDYKNVIPQRDDVVSNIFDNILIIISESFKAFFTKFDS